MLNSLTKVVPPHGGWKIVAVDNASTDDSAKIIKGHMTKLPLTLLYQAKQGKNFALNYAIPYCEGDLTVFTDDDIIASPDWLLGYERLANEKQEYSVFGGRIIAHWPGNEPKAIVQTIPQGPAYAIHKGDMDSGPTTPGMLWGPNIAIRSSVFEGGIRFNEDIGPSVGSYIMGSETELNFRLSDAGYLFWFESPLAVKHQIRPEQLSPTWLAGRAKRFGRATTFKEYQQNGTPKVPLVMGVPRWQYRALIESWAMKIFGKVTQNDCVMLEGLWKFNFYLGTIYEHRSRSIHGF
jgi:glycosyltransferase involved in cell wall biosynthesis